MRSSQVPLRVRLLFKTAHFQEARLRHNKALKYYSAAYALCNGIRPSSSAPPYSAGGGYPSVASLPGPSSGAGASLLGLAAADSSFLPPSLLTPSDSAPLLPSPPVPVPVSGPGDVTLGEVKAVAELLNLKIMQHYALCGE